MAAERACCTNGKGTGLGNGNGSGCGNGSDKRQRCLSPFLELRLPGYVNRISHGAGLTFLAAIRRLVPEEYVDQRLRIVSHRLAVLSANIYRHLGGVVDNLKLRQVNR